MIKRFVLTNATGHGFITHEDQEKAGLHFRVIPIGLLGLAWNKLVIVKCDDESAIDSWIARVSGKEISKEMAFSHAATLLDAAKTTRLQELDAEKAEVKNWTTLSLGVD